MDGYDDIAELYDFAVEQGHGDTNFSLVMAPRLHARLAPGQDGPPALLDVGCGCGQLAVYFALRGSTVLGLDCSAAMLAQAARNSARAGVDDRVELRQADATCFEVGRRFDVATAIFNVVNHLADEAALAAAFGCVRRALVDGGLFAFDLNTRRLLETWSGCDTFSFPGPGGAERFMVRQRSYDPAGQVARRELVCFEAQADGRYRKRVGVSSNRAYASDRVAALLEEAGFDQVGFHHPDELEARAAAPEELPVVFVIARAGQDRRQGGERR